MYYMSSQSREGGRAQVNKAEERAAALVDELQDQINPHIDHRRTADYPQNKGKPASPRFHVPVGAFLPQKGDQPGYID